MTPESWLHGFYLFTTIFAVGVTAVDMLGILGTGEGDGDGGDGAGEAASAGGYGPLLSILRYLRTFVYFSLGFGPLGLVAEATGAGVLGSLAWAVPGGIVAAFLARAFFRFQQQDIDSSVQEEELLFERARVTVPISHRDMGRVRVKMGQAIVERYALAENEEDSFHRDEVVQIVQVTDDHVYVRRAEGSLSLDESW
jgi:membrane protein implicated in regulation of membrane protease activity